MKRSTILTLLLASSAASAADLPATKPYTTSVSLTAPLQGLSLEAAIDSISRAAGIAPILKDIPNVTIKTSFKNKPYRDVLSTLVNVYGEGRIEAVELPGGIIVVAPRTAITRLQNDLSPASAQTKAVLKVYPVTQAPVEVAAAVGQFIPDARVVTLGNTLLVSATDAVHRQVADLLKQVDASGRVATGTGALPGALPGFPGFGTAPTPATPGAVTPAAPTDAPSATEPAPAPAPAATELRSYPVLGDVSEITSALKDFIPDSKVTYLASLKTLLIDAVPATHTKVDALLRMVNVKTAAPATDDAITMTYQLVGDNTEILDAVRRFVPAATVQLLDNSSLLMVSAAPELQVKVTELLNQINQPPSNVALSKKNGGEVLQDVITLRYARADEVATQLTKILAEPSAAPTTPAPATPGAAPATPAAPAAPATATQTTTTGVSNARVVADTRSNAIVVMGTQRQIERVREAVRALDVEIKQVRLKVRVEQVSSTAANSLGLQWNASIAGFSVAGGATGVSAGYKAGTAPFSIEASLNALRSAGQSKTIMDSTFLAVDNQDSKFNAGGTLNIKLTTTGGDTANPTAVQSFQQFPYGLILNFKPRLGSDGNIEIDLDTTVSNKPTGDLNAYFFTEENKMSSRVNLKSGTTVVLGGLITSTTGNKETGVPLLSQIPLLGGLFKKTEAQNDQSTLLIVVSGEIVDSEGKVVTFGPAPASSVRTNSIDSGATRVNVSTGK